MAGHPPVAECHVWHAPVGAADVRLAALLDPAERARWRALRNRSEQCRYLAAHALARLVLASATGSAPAELRFVRRCIACGSADHGKPRLAGERVPLHFSVSHAGGVVAVALAREVPVGIDLEPRGAAMSDAVAALFLSERERRDHALLPEHARPAALLRSWTRKEAVLKATGEGLSRDPRLLRAGAGHVALPWRGQVAHVRDFDPDARHIGCVATLDIPPALTVHAGRALLEAGALTAAAA